MDVRRLRATAVVVVLLLCLGASAVSTWGGAPRPTVVNGKPGSRSADSPPATTAGAVGRIPAGGSPVTPTPKPTGKAEIEEALTRIDKALAEVLQVVEGLDYLEEDLISR